LERLAGRAAGGTIKVVQTFLPYPEFERCAAVLDRQRLGKQRVECVQIMKALCLPGYGWAHHPAVLMWRDYERALVAYTAAICTQWRERGYADTCQTQVEILGGKFPDRGMPWWLGDERLHESHRSNLLRKDPTWYAPLFEAGLMADMDYVWPVRAAKTS
jgi:hypothetical protein